MINHSASRSQESVSTPEHDHEAVIQEVARILITNLDIRVVGHGTSQRNLFLALQRFQRHVQDPPGLPVVDVGKSQGCPNEYAKQKQVNPTRTGGYNPDYVMVGNKCSILYGILAFGSPHSESVPNFPNFVSLAATRHEDVHYLGSFRVTAVHTVETEIGPHRAQTAEGFTTVETVSPSTFSARVVDSSSGRSFPDYA